MKKILVTPLFLLATIFAAHAADSWRAQSSPGPMKDTVKTVLAGWQLAHFPDNEAKFLMIGNAKRPVAAITDYPDSLEIRAFNGSSGEFITVRDKTMTASTRRLRDCPTAQSSNLRAVPTSSQEWKDNGLSLSCREV